MDEGLPIRIAPKRGRLPRKYEVIDNRTLAQKLRVIAWLLLTGAVVTGLILWRMPR